MFFTEKSTKLVWRLNPHTHITSVMLCQLSYQALYLRARWWGERVYMCSTHTFWCAFPYGTPLGDDVTPKAVQSTCDCIFIAQ